MDKGTLIGLVLAFGLIFGSILMGGSLGAFIDVPSLLIVAGGTVAAALVAENLPVCVSGVKVAMHAFLYRSIPVESTIKSICDLAQVARKEGLLALENQKVEDSFLAKGIRLAVDGLPPEEVKSALRSEMMSLRERHKEGQRLFKFMASTAPAMGMVGTLIGLVQMLQTMDDPASIGPAMAVALLTTFYGAILAFVIFGPIANKLEIRTKAETKNMVVILEGMDSILKGENARIVQEKLDVFLAPKERQQEKKAA